MAKAKRLSDFDEQMLRLHRGSRQTECMVTQEKRAQRRLERKGYLCQAGHAAMFWITDKGIEYLEGK